MVAVSILNYKGGVGKTTFTACVAQALSIVGYRVLVIDNDHQCNLTLAVGHRPQKPTIRDIYLSSIGNSNEAIGNATRSTDIPTLSVITSATELSGDDVKDLYHLKKCILFSRLKDKFDYLFIDNSPGLDRLQQASLHASDKVFVPTELSRFAISGIYEMHRTMQKSFVEDSQITKVIPVLYKDTKQQNAYMQILSQLLPGKLTTTMIPFDSVFTDLQEQQKILFLHRLASKAAEHYQQLVAELFGLPLERFRDTIRLQRNDFLKSAARDRLERLRENKSREKAE